jgi:hypothetical protein
MIGATWRAVFPGHRELEKFPEFHVDSSNTTAFG